MSGGYFEYKQYEFSNIADSIEQVLIDWEAKKKSEYGDSIKWDFTDPQTILELVNAMNICRQAVIYAQRVDWLLSGDDSEKSFHKRLKEDMKKLWKISDDQEWNPTPNPDYSGF